MFRTKPKYEALYEEDQAEDMPSEKASKLNDQGELVLASRLKLYCFVSSKNNALC
jgi:hypothetical protein